MTTVFTPSPLVRTASTITIGSLLDNVARAYPSRIALQQGARRVRFDELSLRTNRLAHWLLGQGAGRGHRVALLSENRIEYLEIMLAAAKAGCILACQNWRLSARELSHCIGLVEPKLILGSSRYAATTRS